jgi:hypothetical protein
MVDKNGWPGFIDAHIDRGHDGLTTVLAGDP